MRALQLALWSSICFCEAAGSNCCQQPLFAWINQFRTVCVELGISCPVVSGAEPLFVIELWGWLPACSGHGAAGAVAIRRWKPAAAAVLVQPVS